MHSLIRMPFTLVGLVIVTFLATQPWATAQGQPMAIQVDVNGRKRQTCEKRRGAKGDGYEDAEANACHRTLL